MNLITLLLLLLIEETYVDGTTCSFAALEVSILAENSYAFGATEIKPFSTLGLFLKSIQ